MVEADLRYVDRLLELGVIDGPVVELGVGYGGSTCRASVLARGLGYYGTDLNAGSGVDFVADFENARDMSRFAAIAPVGTVLILNVLEHTFDPIRVLDNAVGLLRGGGTVVMVTPAIWPLHNYPMDAWRLLPNFYEQYAARRGLKLLQEHFEYVGIGRVDSHKGEGDTYRFPSPVTPGLRGLVDRAVHKGFNTFGRGMFHPSHVAVGAVLQVAAGQPLAASADANTDVARTADLLG
jgi:SAM-dependent methyltransferase